MRPFFEATYPALVQTASHTVVSGTVDTANLDRLIKPAYVVARRHLLDDWFISEDPLHGGLRES